MFDNISFKKILFSEILNFRSAVSRFLRDWIGLCSYCAKTTRVGNAGYVGSATQTADMPFRFVLCTYIKTLTIIIFDNNTKIHNIQPS
jgi:hypothetical protein